VTSDFVFDYAERVLWWRAMGRHCWSCRSNALFCQVERISCSCAV